MAGRYPALKEDPKVVQFPGTAASDSKKELTPQELRKLAREHKPRGLTKEQQAVWNRVMPEFIQAGRFKTLYIEFFRMYCVTVARMEENLEYLERAGWKYTTEGRNGTQHKTRPEAAQYNDDWRKWNSMVNQIGMSPATDQRFHGIQPDLFDDLY